MHRRSGVILAPAALPGPFAIGDLGPAAYRFVDFLASSGQSVWSVLPLLVPDSLGSPFDAPSSLAGNWLLVSPELLVEDGLLPPPWRSIRRRYDRISYRGVNAEKRRAIGIAWKTFREQPRKTMCDEFAAFCKRERWWLRDYGLYMALKDRYGGKPWYRWPVLLRDRHTAALAAWEHAHKAELDYFAFGQWLFDRQWKVLKQHANAKGIHILGNLPFFAAHDSVDVWVHRQSFYIRRNGQMRYVAAGAPDDFAPHGQHWGYPLYRWAALRKNNLLLWRHRLFRSRDLYDLLVLDHFRGYVAVWGAPARATTALRGHWYPTPGTKLLRVFRRAAPDLPLIAEDLGLITSRVHELRNHFRLQGMRIVLQGLRDGVHSHHFPRNVPANSVALLGTHDQPTARGWLNVVSGRVKKFAFGYLGASPKNFAWKAMEAGMRSKSTLFLLQMQDVLELDDTARWNNPGRKTGNWVWRMPPRRLSVALARKLRACTHKALR